MAGMDSLFDLAEDVLDGIDRVIGPPGGSTSDQPKRTDRAQSVQSPASRRGSSSPSSGPSSSTAVTRRSYRVVEFIDGSGADTWVVTNGYDRAECSSAEFAARVRYALG